MMMNVSVPSTHALTMLSALTPKEVISVDAQKDIDYCLMDADVKVRFSQA